MNELETWIAKVLVWLVREVRKIKGQVAHEALPGEPPPPPSVADQLNAQELQQLQQDSSQVGGS